MSGSAQGGLFRLSEDAIFLIKKKNIIGIKIIILGGPGLRPTQGSVGKPPVGEPPVGEASQPASQPYRTLCRAPPRWIT